MVSSELKQLAIKAVVGKIELGAQLTTTQRAMVDMLYEFGLDVLARQQEDEAWQQLRVRT